MGKLRAPKIQRGAQSNKEQTLLPSHLRIFLMQKDADKRCAADHNKGKDNSAVRFKTKDINEDGHRQDRAASQDRKSTRLNSSHPSISYAVFCLKKKKKY